MRLSNSIFDDNDSNEKNILQKFIMHVLGFCIKLEIFVAHMFYAWSSSHTTALPIDINQKNHTLLCLFGELVIKIKK